MFAAALMDPHPLLRLGLARILGAISSIGDVQSFDPDHLGLAGASFLHTMPVDILLFGLAGDETRERALLATLTERVAPRHILLLTDETRAPAVWHPAVAGRIRRSAPSDLVEAAVKLVLAGGRCFPDATPATVGLPPTPAMATPGPAPIPVHPFVTQHAHELGITPRQFEVLMLRARGLSLKAVGAALHISEATVKAHASSMYRRLDVANCHEAVQLALQRGIPLQTAETRAPVSGER